ncbi:MAG: N-acetylmuramoyl-L-alanine amidase [Gammaproteobacteria bacterium]|nr:N-acetylmuramoyl-L-alanine amidase [Gammaproteobacteria bacterium]
MQAAITYIAALGRLIRVSSFLTYLENRLAQALRSLLVVALSASAFGTELVGIRYSDSPLYTRVVFDLSAPPTFTSDLLSNPARFFVDIRDAKLSQNFKTPFIESIQFRGVRFGDRNGSLRVVLDLTDGKVPKIQTLGPNGPHGDRLVIDFPHEVVESCVAEHDNNIVVVVDAGHGGEDPGAIAVNRAMEKHITLSISQKVQARINRQPGFRVVMTRDRDYEVPLHNRYRVAQNTKARLFVSIHADAFHNPRPRGASAYVLSQGKAQSELAKWLVQNENRADWVGGVSAWVDSSCYAEREKLKFLNVKGRQEALAEAVSVGKKMLHSIDSVAEIHPKSFDSRRGEYQVTDAGFVVLSATAIPSILVETGFLSNPQEARLLSTDAHQSTIANAISDTILRHFCENPPRYTDLAEGKVACDLEPTTVVYKVRRGDSLSVIASRQQVSVAAIRAANALTSDRIYPGQTLTIPVTN